MPKPQATRVVRGFGDYRNIKVVKCGGQEELAELKQPQASEEECICGVL